MLINMADCKPRQLSQIAERYSSSRSKTVQGGLLLSLLLLSSHQILLLTVFA